jgi:UDP-N-acetylglucosamine transferase subunit ALG13
MIFVSVGTHEAPFDRLLLAVRDLRLDEELVVQHGPSSVRCERATTEFDYLPFEQVVELVREARVVVTHAGVGSVMLALSNDKRPVVMARVRELGEHVDDHQLELATRLDGAGLVELVEDGAGLAAAVARSTQVPTADDAALWLGDSLRDYLAATLGEPVTPGLPF